MSSADNLDGLYEVGIFNETSFVDFKNISGLNESEFPSDVDEGSESSSSISIYNLSLAILLSLLIATSISGNLLVCIAIWTDKSLRKLSNLFFISLAMADLLLSTLVMPFAIVNDLTGAWIFGSDYCNLWIATDVMCCTASIVSLLAISLERYIHIKDPLQYTEWLTRKSVPVSILLIWVISALISFLPISLGLHAPHSGQKEILQRNNAATLPLVQYQVTSPHTGLEEATTPASELGPSTGSTDSAVNMDLSSVEPQCQLDFSPIYSITSSIVSFFLPCAIMVIIYFHLFAIARRHLEEMKAHTRPLIRLRLLHEQQQLEESKKAASTKAGSDDNENNTTNTNISEVPNVNVKNVNPGDKSKQVVVSIQSVETPLLQEHKAAITIGIIMGVFLLCWTPFFIINVVAGFCKDCISPITFKVLTWLGYSNSAFNPIIYTIFNAEFRSAFHKILTSVPAKIGVHFFHRDPYSSSPSSHMRRYKYEQEQRTCEYNKANGKV